MKLNVVLVAEEAAGARALQLIADRAHHVVALFTNSQVSNGTATVAERAKSLRVPVRDAGDVRYATSGEWLRKRRVDILLNVHSLYIIHPDVLDAPRLGAYNLHPGPLPERAGLHTASWALYEGADRYGVTLHRMTPDVDAGTIAFAEDFKLSDRDTGLTVMAECGRRGVGLIQQLLQRAERGGSIPARPQDLSRRRWYTSGPPQEGRVDWGSPARRIVDFVRACDYRPFASPWGFPRCSAGSIDLAIVSARRVEEPADAVAGTVRAADGGSVLVAASDQWVRVDEVEIGGRGVAPAEVLTPGSCLQQAS